ncbi:TolB family protein [Desulfurivibrio sp. D14AmB]|uniref:TolB family protein n=1 Tax=Desulfurivibrio sp. D14AmB TaxID=3374370 RepID=UPI00376EB035
MSDHDGFCVSGYSRDIMVMDLFSDQPFPGSIIHQLNYNGAPVAAPAFAPEGNRIVALKKMTTGYGNYGNLVVFDLINDHSWIIDTGDDPVRTWYDGSSPAWSPQGNQIVYYLDRQYSQATGKIEGQFDLFRINPDGTGKIRLTDDDFVNTLPDWSPDGEWIIFSSNRDRGAAADGMALLDLWIMDKNGNNLEKILDCSPASCLEPKFSPDGQTIAFTNLSNIFTVSSDGDPGTLRKIAEPGYLVWGISWSPYLPRPTMELQVDPPFIAPGDLARISWTSTGAAQVRIMADGQEEVHPANGYLFVSPDSTTTYTVTAIGISGARVDTVTITVQ